MRTKKASSVLLALALGAPLAGAAALPAFGAADTSAVPAAAVGQVDAGLLPTADRPHTRMRATITGPLEFGFVVRPKLRARKNWRVVLKVKECGAGKRWVVAQRARTKGRAEVFNHDGMKVIRALMRDDGQFSGVRAYRLITPKQRGHARTVKTFRNYPLDANGFLRIGVCR